MPRSKKNPDAPSFDFKTNPDKTLASTTLSNYKNALNRLTEYSTLEHGKDASKPVLKTKDDLLTHTKYVLELLNTHVPKRLTKTTTLASIFYIIGRQEDQHHPYVAEFRRLYYTPDYLARRREAGEDV